MSWTLVWLENWNLPGSIPINYWLYEENVLKVSCDITHALMRTQDFTVGFGRVGAHFEPFSIRLLLMIFSFWMNLPIIFCINRLIIWFRNITKTVRNVITITLSVKQHLHVYFVKTYIMKITNMVHKNQQIFCEAEMMKCFYDSINNYFQSIKLTCLDVLSYIHHQRPDDEVHRPQEFHYCMCILQLQYHSSCTTVCCVFVDRCV